MANPKDIVTIEAERADSMTASELAALGGRKLVYVRAVQVGDVLDDLVDEEGDMIVDLPGDAVLYSVHAADGERIALVGDRDLAFAAARQNEMNPVSVH